MEDVSLLTNKTFLGNSEVKILKEACTKHVNLHCHEFYEIEFILNGEGDGGINEERTHLSKGMVSLITPKDYHKFLSKQGFELINIAFHESALSDNLLSAILMTDKPMQTKLSGEKFAILKKLTEILELSASINNREFVVDTLETLIYMVFSDKLSKKEFSDFVEKAIKYVDMHYRDNPALKEVAKIAGKTPEYFCSFFKRQTGLYYSEYLNNKKVKSAELLLSITDISISEICYECGFTSMSNFLRVFKDVTGKSPGEFRKMRNNKLNAHKYPLVLK